MLDTTFKKIIFMVIGLLSLHALNAQYSIQGKVANTENEPLVGATIVLLDRDSTMVSFGLSNTNGEFEMEDVDEGEYILQATFISYANYSSELNINGNEKAIKVDDIVLEESSEVLQEITISAEHIPMGIKGDTISYNAAAFKTRPNATVEDLLRKLPGIEVERNGNIKAQGEDVENVLVDGKEFFGNDPTMATKNLEAEAVDKVEVYDKKSEVAEFTGIDDGDEEKTINLKLKDDHKKGGFGNVNLAGGTEQTYDGKLNYFRFSPELQASIILSANNINQETFTINDRIEFMGGIANAMSGGSLNLSDYQGMQDGINSSLSAGLNFSYDFSPKLTFRSHYILNRNENILQKTSNYLNFTDEFEYSNSNESDNSSEYFNHQFNTKIKYKQNPFSEWIFRNNLMRNDRIENRFSNSIYQINGTESGFAFSDLVSGANSWGYDSNTQFKRKFDKKGRSFIAGFTLKLEQDRAEDNFLATNRIVENSFDLNQRQNYNNARRQISGTLNYTEPLSKKYFLGLNYKYGNSNERPFRNYYDISDNTEFLNDELSADFQKNYVYHVGGLSLRRNVSRLKMIMGLSVQRTFLEGIIEERDRIEGTFINYLPSFNLDYDLKGGQSLDLNYSTSVNAPELEQMLPLPNNLFANYNYIGNPGLVPEYNNRLSLQYNYFNNFNFTNFWANLTMEYALNRIVTKTNIDENLFRTIQPINTEDYRSISSFLSFSQPFRPLKINYRIRARYRYAIYDSFINDLLSETEDANANIKLSINNKKKKYLDIESGIAFDFYNKKYGLNPDFNQSYYNIDYFMDGEIYLPKGWTIGSQLTYRQFSEEEFADSPSFLLWSANVSKLFLDDKMEIRLSAFDLLNQNIGFRRQGTSNSLSEINFNNLSRYFQLGIHYRIGKARDSGIRIDMD